MGFRSVVGFAVVAVFLYWVVQAPHDAAIMIKHLWDGLVELAQLVADRLITFLSALRA